MPVRKTLEDGIFGIAKEYKEMYEISNDGVYVSINNEYLVPLEAIIKVQESTTDYEVQTKGVYINMSKTEKVIKTLVRM
jgi:archaellum component FlaF (FlaF/FlaG flagellin family)